MLHEYSVLCIAPQTGNSQYVFRIDAAFFLNVFYPWVVGFVDNMVVTLLVAVSQKACQKQITKERASSGSHLRDTVHHSGNVARSVRWLVTLRPQSGSRDR